LRGDGGVAFTGVGDADTEATRLKRLRAAKLPNNVHASIAASDERNKRADAVYFGSHSGRGVWPLMWSGTQYESTRLATAAR